MTVELTLEIVIFLFTVGVVAGTIDILAGGGGLLTVPALLVCGMSPILALGTNKLQATCGTATATFSMLRRGKMDGTVVRGMMLMAFLGSVMGTVAVQFVDAATLEILIPIVLVLILGYFIRPVRKVVEEPEPRLSKKTYLLSVVPGIGAYDGMIGPGTGSFYAVAGMSLRGLPLLEATVQAKALNFATNLASLIVFILAGKIVWVAGSIMIVGQVIGAWIGSHVLFKINLNYLRGLIVLMSLAMLIKFVSGKL